jgi:hypothetical protein
MFSLSAHLVKIVAEIVRRKKKCKNSQVLITGLISALRPSWKILSGALLF